MRRSRRLSTTGPWRPRPLRDRPPQSRPRIRRRQRGSLLRRRWCGSSALALFLCPVCCNSVVFDSRLCASPTRSSHSTAPSPFSGPRHHQIRKLSQLTGGADPSSLLEPRGAKRTQGESSASDAQADLLGALAAERMRSLQLEECLRFAGIAVPARVTVGAGGSVGGSGGGSAAGAAAAGAPVGRAAARLGVQLGPDGGDLRSLVASAVQQR